MKKLRPLYLAICVALMLCACGDPTPEPAQTQPPATTQPAVEETLPLPEQTQPQTALEILSTREAGEYVEVATTYGNFRYPFAFSEVIKIQTVSDSLEFSVTVLDTDVKLFTFFFDGTGSIVLGQLAVDGQDKLLAAQLYSPPEGLDDAGIQTFYAAQEIFNDVAVSFQENENFAPIN